MHFESKTEWVIIDRTNSKFSPVNNLLKLINLLGIKDEISDQIFYLSPCKSGYRIGSGKKAQKLFQIKIFISEWFKAPC